MATVECIGQLHAECDWLIKCFDVRKEVRNGEIDVRGKVKTVLSGADHSSVHETFVQVLEEYMMAVMVMAGRCYQQD